MLANKRIYAYAAIAVGVLLIGALAVVFGLRAARLDPPAQAVQSLLELRSANSTDTKAYERYVESTSVASALAEDSAIVCRASSGTVLVERGTRVPIDSEFLAECLVTGQIARCDDAETDPRVALEENPCQRRRENKDDGTDGFHNAIGQAHLRIVDKFARLRHDHRSPRTKPTQQKVSKCKDWQACAFPNEKSK